VAHECRWIVGVAHVDHPEGRLNALNLTSTAAEQLVDLVPLGFLR
jgi:hypothetical protein